MRAHKMNGLEHLLIANVCSNSSNLDLSLAPLTLCCQPFLTQKCIFYVFFCFEDLLMLAFPNLIVPTFALRLNQRFPLVYIYFKEGLVPPFLCS